MSCSVTSSHAMVVVKDPEHWVPDASTLVLADFSGSCKVQHPSEAVNVEVLVSLLPFALLIKTCHTVFWRVLLSYPTKAFLLCA